MDAWIECAWFKCRKRFEPGRRSNGAHHTGALYCSRSCQQKAYRHRQSGVTVADAPGAGATVTLAPAPAPQPLAAPSASNARPTIHLPEGAVLSDWNLRIGWIFRASGQVNPGDLFPVHSWIRDQ